MGVIFRGHESRGSWWELSLLFMSAYTHTHTHTHTRIFSLSSVSLHVLLYYFIPFSLSSITGILSSSLGSVRLVGNNVKMLCLSSSLWRRTHTHTHTHAYTQKRKVNAVKRRFRGIFFAAFLFFRLPPSPDMRRSA